jgi:hypothetical protein
LNKQEGRFDRIAADDSDVPAGSWQFYTALKVAESKRLQQGFMQGWRAACCFSATTSFTG